MKDQNFPPGWNLTASTHKSPNPLVELTVEEQNDYVGKNAKYYLYSEIKEFVFKQLI
ncbi:MAG: hypothetical protein HC769_07230 [Cyanobacteria bacterium CRU_2_1]|nr:hypothetical protein [Cyanobacteria bacterium CRU_2_1]